MLKIGTVAVLGELSRASRRDQCARPRRDMPGEHERGVARGLSARELQLVGAQHDGMTTQLVDADLERQPRPGRGLLEDQRDALPGERARGERRRLQLERAVEQRGELRGRELGAGQKMCVPWTGQSRLGSSATSAEKGSPDEKRPVLPVVIACSALLFAAGCGSSSSSSTTSSTTVDDTRATSTSGGSESEHDAQVRRAGSLIDRCRAGPCRSPTATSRSTPTRSG